MMPAARTRAEKIAEIHAERARNAVAAGDIGADLSWISAALEHLDHSQYQERAGTLDNAAPGCPEPSAARTAARNRDHITKGNAEMADNQHVTLHFVHPTDSTQVLTATVGNASTPEYLIKELVKSGFVTSPATGASYKLVNTATGKELADRTTLATAGVAGETTLNVLHSVTGARPGSVVR